MINRNLFSSKNILLISGMHRSGTTILTDILQNMGVYVGRKRGDHNEDQLFVSLNDWLLTEYDSTWSNPYRLHDNNQINDDLPFLISHIKNYLTYFFPLSYLSILSLFKYIFIPRNIILGAKDPCFSLFLPIWSKIFSNAKYVFIIRNGINVAQSLKTRQITYNSKNKSRFENNKLFKYYLIYRNHIIRKPRVKAFNSGIGLNDIYNGLKLWDYYNDKITEFTNNLNTSKYHIIRYEDLMQKPDLTISKLYKFVFLKEIDASSLNLLTSLIKTDNKNYKNPSNIPQSSQDLLSKHGY